MNCKVEHWEGDEYVICVNEPNLGLVGGTYHKRDANIIKIFIDNLDKKIKEVDEQGVPVEIELEEKELFMLMNMAHEQNITLNKLVNNFLREQIEREEKNA